MGESVIPPRRLEGSLRREIRDPIDVTERARTTNLDRPEPEDAGNVEAERRGLPHRHEPMHHRDMNLHDIRIAAINNHASLVATRSCIAKLANCTNREWLAGRLRVDIVAREPFQHVDRPA